MKNIILSLFVFFCFVPISLEAQTMACCSLEPSATADFAALGTDEGFVAAHDLPLETTHLAAGKEIRFPIEGGEKGRGYWVEAAEPTDHYIFVIHEWWGLNDHIRREADSLAAALGNVNVLAIDMYDGKVATTRENASKYMQVVKAERAEAIILGAKAYAGESASIATIGWCFGGGWSLKTSLLLGDQAAGCVIYYGMPVRDSAKLAALSCDVLGIFASRDRWITPEIVEDFRQTVEKTDNNISVHMFKADHAFANPSSSRYDQEDAMQARALTRTFLKQRFDKKE
ncbi:MAG: dienelactone hydrolase family protein [Bacteroidia bacterium]